MAVRLTLRGDLHPRLLTSVVHTEYHTLRDMLRTLVSTMCMLGVCVLPVAAADLKTSTAKRLLLLPIRSILK